MSFFVHTVHFCSYIILLIDNILSNLVYFDQSNLAQIFSILFEQERKNWNGHWRARAICDHNCHHWQRKWWTHALTGNHAILYKVFATHDILYKINFFKIMDAKYVWMMVLNIAFDLWTFWDSLARRGGRGQGQLVSSITCRLKISAMDHGLGVDSHAWSNQAYLSTSH